MKRTDQIRQEILIQLYAQRPLAVGAWRIHRDAWKSHYNYSLEEIARELDFLEGEGLAERAESIGASEVKYKISSSGVKHYEQTFAA
jgi:hypothetical protein